MLRAMLGSVVLAVVASSSFARDIVLENYPPAGTLGIVSAFGWGPPGIGVANEYWAQTFKVPEDAGALSRVEFTYTRRSSQKCLATIRRTIFRSGCSSRLTSIQKLRNFGPGP